MAMRMSNVFGDPCKILCLTTVLAGSLSSCASRPSAGIVDGRAGPAPATATGSGRPANNVNVGPAGLPLILDPSASEPVTATMVVRPASAVAGGEVELLVYARVARAHYLHAATNSREPFAPVTMNLTCPDGLEVMSDWQFPPPERGPGNSLVYRDSIVLRRSLRVLPNIAAQTLLVTAELRYQACTDELCWPPTAIELSTPLPIQIQRR